MEDYTVNIFAGVPAKDYQYDETYNYEYDEDTNYDDEIPKPKVIYFNYVKNIRAIRYLCTFFTLSRVELKMIANFTKKGVK